VKERVVEWWGVDTKMEENDNDRCDESGKCEVFGFQVAKFLKTRL